MSCSGCKKRQEAKSKKESTEIYKVFGNYKYLTDRQIKARLENYKKRNCKGCEKKSVCDIALFFKCKGKKET